MKEMVRRKDLALLLTFAWMGVIFYLSHQPASQSSELSGSFVDMLLAFISYLPVSVDEASVHFFIRKSAHFIAYSTLGMLVLHTIILFFTLRYSSVLVAFIITVSYAISDEIHQTFIAGRSGEVRDVLIDSTGSFTGIMTYLVCLMLYHKLSSPGR